MTNRVPCGLCKWSAAQFFGYISADDSLYAPMKLYCDRPGVKVIAEVTEDDWCIFGEVFDGSRFDDLSSCDELEEIENGKEEITGN